MINLSKTIWDNLDIEIKPLIKLLNDNNFKTTCSCSGEEGHSFRFPTVILQYDSEKEYIRLVKLLLDTEIFGFEIAKKETYKNSLLNPEQAIEIIFYNLNRLKLSLLNIMEIREIQEKYKSKKYTQKQLSEEYNYAIFDIRAMISNKKYWI